RGETVDDDVGGGELGHRWSLLTRNSGTASVHRNAAGSRYHRFRVPLIVDYADVLERLTNQGLVSLYHNSGAFGFPAVAKTQAVGWTGPDDPTLRPAARELAVQIPPPYESNLAALLVRFWREQLADA